MRSIVFSIFFLATLAAKAQQTLQERLGYPKDSRLVILHADDLGMSHSENAATFYAMERGCVNSASIMIPTPWAMEAAEYQHNHPGADFGLHLTLTSEWKNLKWGPIASKSEVPGLVNQRGFFFASVDSVYRHATTQEVEKELRAQIEKARALGIDFTHFDSHMGTLFARPDFLKVLLKLGREYKVPVLLSKPIFQMVYKINLDTLITAREVSLNMIYMAVPRDYKDGMENFYTRILTTLQPGVSEIIFHVGYNNDEMQAATVDHPDYGAEWRQQDFNFFSSEKCKKLLSEHHIHLITWKEIRDKLMR